MGQAIDGAGNIWEVDAAGNPVRMIQAAQAPQTGRVFTLPPSPKDVQAAARQAADDARAAAQGRRADRQLELSEAANARAERAASGDPVANAKQMAEWRGNLNNINLLEGTIKKLRQQYRDHFEGKGPIRSLKESYAPASLSPEFGVFETDAQSMIADMAKAKGLTATQFNTPAEARMFFEPLIPRRDDPDEVIVSKLDNLERMIQTGRQTTLQNLGMDAVAGKAEQRANNEVPDPTTGADLKLPPNDGSPPDLPPVNDGDITAATGKSRTTYDARLSSQVDAMINAGASKAMIDAVLKRQNFPAIRSDDLAKAKQWMKANPGKRYYGANISREDDLNVGQRILANPTIAPVAAGAGHYFNTATAGIPAALAGPEGQGALDAAAALNPTASTLGGLAGGVTGALGAEATLAARAPAALARFAPRIADTLYGGLLGFNTAQEGEGLQGAAMGAGAGLAGGFLGEKVMRGAGRLARGVSDPAVQALRARGIPLTVGQTVGSGGAVGQGIKKIEDSLTSVPFVGNMVDARRMEGLEAFNRAAFNEGALGQGAVGRIGPEGVDDLRGIKNDAYDAALGPVQIDPSAPQLGDELNAARSYIAANIPDEIDGARTAALAALDNRIAAAVDPATGMIPGRNFQEAYRGLARTGRERAQRDYGHEIAQSMRQGQDALAGAVEEQFPGSFGQFMQANAINRNLNTISDAVTKSPGSGGVFTPAQLGRADISSTNKLQGKIEAAGTNRPFYDLASDGQAVLPSKVPDSGTWTRALVGGGGIGAAGVTGGYMGGPEGAATGAGGGLLLTAVLAAGGSKPAQKAMTAILADRPDLAVQFGDQLVKNSGIGGWTGTGVLSPLFAGP